MKLTVLGAAVLAGGLLLGVACGGGGGDDDDDAGLPGDRATSVTADAEPIIPGGDPSSFSVTEADIGASYDTDDDHTFARAAGDYQAFGFFDTPEEAKEKLAEWGYRGGYITGFDPVGLFADVLRGRYYSDVELHLFDSIEHAHMAFEHFVRQRASVDGAEYLNSLPAHGNEWAALKLVSGKVTNTDVDAVYHVYFMRRGNMVAVVQTRGAAPYMNDAEVANLAAIIDEKVLGTRDAVQPTPAGGIETPPTITPTP